MAKEFKTILFTTNLSDTSRAAFSHAALLTAQLKAKIILLHVIDIPTLSYENLLIRLFGEKKYNEIIDQHRKEAQNILIGKVPSRDMASSALSEFCRESGIHHDECGYYDHEIVIKEGDVVETIIQQATEHNCDFIIMGASEGMISGSSTLGSNVKEVLNKSRIPTLVVSPAMAA